MANSLNPKEIVEELNKYIIGQDAAKRAVAIALRNRWRRRRTPEVIREEIMPNNIILIGPTGVGKTEIARRLAKLAGAPFVKVEATKFTEVGYVGRDVESMVRDLAENAVNIVRNEKTKEIEHAARFTAENIIVDKLMPPLGRGHSFDSVGDEEIEENKRARAQLLQQLQNGELLQERIDIDVKVDAAASMQIFGPFGGDDVSMQVQEMMGSILPKKTKTRTVAIEEALVLLQKEETDKILDMDAIIKEALELAQNSGIIFIDEIDKISSRSSTGSQNGPEVSREGVQRDLLPIVEGCTVNTKYGYLKTDHILFIASGAFHVSKPSDLIPELQGRFPIRVELRNLEKDDFVRILTMPEHALLKQYQALMHTENTALQFTDDAIEEIAAIATLVNDQVANIGARRLHTILTTLLDEILFEAPNAQTVTIDTEYVRQRLQSIASNVDLSRYIL